MNGNPAAPDRSNASSAPCIRSVEVLPLRLPFARPFKMATAHEPSRDNVEIVVVRLTADNGIVGIGETQAWRRQGSGETLPGLVSTIRDRFAPAMVGRSVFDIAAIMANLDIRIAGSLSAQAAVGDALYDCAARSLGLPLHDFLGGRSRDRIPVGFAFGISGDPSGMIDAAEEAIAKGYRHFRIKIGLDPERDHATMATLRRHFDDRIALRADANGAMSHGDALRLLSKLEAYDLEVVEQPVAAWNLESMSELARAVRIPLSADESLTTDHSLVEIARRRAASAIQTKIGKNGGIHAIRRLWTLADAFGLGIYPGNHPSSGVSVAAAAHLAASWPGTLLVGDFQIGADNMIAEDILVRPVEVRDGHVVVPSGPGLGIELDEEKLERFRADRA